MMALRGEAHSGTSLVTSFQPYWRASTAASRADRSSSPVSTLTSPLSMRTGSIRTKGRNSSCFGTLSSHAATAAHQTASAAAYFTLGQVPLHGTELAHGQSSGA